MTLHAIARYFGAYGLFWRKIHRWGVRNIPPHLEPFVAITWAALFLLFSRTGLADHVRAIFPGSSRLRSAARVFRVYYNFAWTFTDAARFQELRTIPDWEFVGFDHFSKLTRSPEGAIILTAHMGNYDLGAYLFSEKMNRPITVVRAPEPDPEAGDFEDVVRLNTISSEMRVGYNTASEDLAIELLDTIRGGGIVAIQGDRVTGDVSSMEASLFGKHIDVPTGPFALAMASRAPIYPLFVVRLRRRHYRIVTLPPFSCTRTGRDRKHDLQKAVDRWASDLESAARQYWFQWFTFPNFYREDRC